MIAKFTAGLAEETEVFEALQQRRATLKKLLADSQGYSLPLIEPLYRQMELKGPVILAEAFAGVAPRSATDEIFELKARLAKASDGVFKTGVDLLLADKGSEKQALEEKLGGLGDVRKKLLDIALRLNPQLDVKFVRELQYAGPGLVASGLPTSDMAEVAGMFEQARNLATISLSERFDVFDTMYHEAWHSLEVALKPEEQEALQRAFPANGRFSHEERTAVAFANWALKREKLEDMLPSEDRKIVRQAFRRAQVIAGRGREMLHDLGLTDPDKVAEIFESAFQGEIGERLRHHPVTTMKHSKRVERGRELLRRQYDFQAGLGGEYAFKVGDMRPPAAHAGGLEFDPGIAHPLDMELAVRYYGDRAYGDVGNDEALRFLRANYDFGRLFPPVDEDVYEFARYGYEGEDKFPGGVVPRQAMEAAKAHLIQQGEFDWEAFDHLLGDDYRRLSDRYREEAIRSELKGSFMLEDQQGSDYFLVVRNSGLVDLWGPEDGPEGGDLGWLAQCEDYHEAVDQAAAHVRTGTTIYNDLDKPMRPGPAVWHRRYVPQQDGQHRNLLAFGAFAIKSEQKGLSFSILHLPSGETVSTGIMKLGVAKDVVEHVTRRGRDEDLASPVFGGGARRLVEGAWAGVRAKVRERDKRLAATATSTPTVFFKATEGEGLSPLEDIGTMEARFPKLAEGVTKMVTMYQVVDQEGDPAFMEYFWEAGVAKWLLEHSVASEYLQERMKPILEEKAREFVASGEAAAHFPYLDFKDSTPWEDLPDKVREAVEFYVFSREAQPAHYGGPAGAFWSVFEDSPFPELKQDLEDEGHYGLFEYGTDPDQDAESGCAEYAFSMAAQWEALEAEKMLQGGYFRVADDGKYLLWVSKLGTEGTLFQNDIGESGEYELEFIDSFSGDVENLSAGRAERVEHLDRTLEKACINHRATGRARNENDPINDPADLRAWSRRRRMRTSDGGRARVEVRGDFGISSDSYFGHQDGWQIYHLGTGRALGREVRRLDDAKLMAETLQNKLPWREITQGNEALFANEIDEAVRSVQHRAGREARLLRSEHAAAQIAAAPAVHSVFFKVDDEDRFTVTREDLPSFDVREPLTLEDLAEALEADRDDLLATLREQVREDSETHSQASAIVARQLSDDEILQHVNLPHDVIDEYMAYAERAWNAPNFREDAIEEVMSDYGFELEEGEEFNDWLERYEEAEGSRAAEELQNEISDKEYDAKREWAIADWCDDVRCGRFPEGWEEFYYNFDDKIHEQEQELVDEYLESEYLSGELFLLDAGQKFVIAYGSEDGYEDRVSIFEIGEGYSYPALDHKVWVRPSGDMNALEVAQARLEDHVVTGRSLYSNGFNERMNPQGPAGVWSEPEWINRFGDRTVKARTRDSFGIVYYRPTGSYYYDDANSGYQLYHLGTGRSVGKFMSRLETAQAVAEKLEPLLPWKDITPKSMLELAPQIEAVAEKAIIASANSVRREARRERGKAYAADVARQEAAVPSKVFFKAGEGFDDILAAHGFKPHEMWKHAWTDEDGILEIFQENVGGDSYAVLADNRKTMFKGVAWSWSIEALAQLAKDQLAPSSEKIPRTHHWPINSVDITKPDDWQKSPYIFLLHHRPNVDRKMVGVHGPAEVYGSFAVHQQPWSGRWSISHLPTGRSVLLRGGYEKKDHAKRTVEFLTAIRSTEWWSEIQADSPKWLHHEPLIRDALTDELNKMAEADRQAMRAATKEDRANTVFFSTGAKTPDSPEFRKWFGSSVAKDETGSPLVLYHGSSTQFHAFRHDRTGSNFGQSGGYFFTDNPARAGEYAEAAALDNRSQGPQLYPVYISVQNPLKVSSGAMHPDAWAYQQADTLIPAARKQGNDGIVVFGDDGSKLYIVLEPGQVKSIFNQGGWSRDQDDILLKASEIQPANWRDVIPAHSRYERHAFVALPEPMETDVNETVTALVGSMSRMGFDPAGRRLDGRTGIVGQQDRQFLTLKKELGGLMGAVHRYQKGEHARRNGHKNYKPGRDQGDKGLVLKALESAKSNLAARELYQGYETLEKRIAAAVLDGQQWKTIADLSKWVERGDRSKDEDTKLVANRHLPSFSRRGEWYKFLDEKLEEGLNIALRDYHDRHKDQTKLLAFAEALEDRVPARTSRTSNSVRMQAHSTPPGLGVLVGMIAGIDDHKSVYDPAAGHGALAVLANKSKVHVNELDPERAQSLMRQGFGKVTFYDARREPLRISGAAADRYDIVVMNPPFGGDIGRDGKPTGQRFYLEPQLSTTRQDFAMAASQLRSMKDDGRAVLILGAPKLQNGNREDGYRKGAFRAFYHHLYNNYKVTRHLTLDGKFFRKQGANWPVELVLIEGKGKSSLQLPGVKAPALIHDYDTLKEVLHDDLARVSALQTSLGFDLAAGGRAIQTGADATSSHHDPQIPGPADRDESAGNQAGRNGPLGAASGAGRENGEPDSLHPGGHDDGRTERSGMAAEGHEHRRGESSDVQPSPDRGASGEGLRVVPSSGSGREGITGAEGLVYDGRGNPAGNPGTTAIPGTGSTPGDGQHQAVELSDSSGLSGENNMVGEQMTAAAATKRNQADYIPRSTAPKMGSLVPSNISAQMQKALDDVEDRFGPIDDFVAKELGYDVPEGKTAGQALGKYFGAEQVDTIALHIAADKDGDAIVVGHQAGKGKGRICAAMIRYARIQGRTPIFVTERPDLYPVIARDLADIGEGGLRFFMTNDGLSGSKALKMPDGTTLSSQPKAKHEDLMLEAIATRKLDADVILTTPSQLQTVRGKDTVRRDFIRAFAADSSVIIDESHNFGGQQGVQRKFGAPDDRAQFIRNILKESVGASYSSATWAKRPDVMGLYHRTAIGRAGMSPDMVIEVIARGGVPMQQAVTGMLAESGQYTRLERSFEDIVFSSELVPVNEASYDRVAAILSKINEFDEYKHDLLRGELGNDLAKSSLSGSGDAAIGEIGVESTHFTSLMHNVLRQINFASKADYVAEKAIEDLSRAEKHKDLLRWIEAQDGLDGPAKEVRARIYSSMPKDLQTVAVEAGLIGRPDTFGSNEPVIGWIDNFDEKEVDKGQLLKVAGDRKPIIAVQLTMGSFLEQYAEDAGLTSGDFIPASFGDILEKYLERSRDVTIGSPYGERKREALTDAQLGPEGRALFKEALEMIRATDFSDLPISPIDYVKQKVRDAGFTIGEISGRNNYIDYEDGPVYRRKSSAETASTAHVQTRDDFNNGKLDAVILNKSAASGGDFHASEKFLDQRQRDFIIWQADADVNVFEQLNGRPNRTGQVVPPVFSMPIGDIPAERRPLAVLQRALASLNANTSANRRAGITADLTGSDFLNELGDEVAARLMEDDRSTHYRLASPLSANRTGEGFEREDAARKVTGRLGFLPVEEQKAFYRRFDEEYAAEVKRAAILGTNSLEAGFHDLKAAPARQMEFIPEAGGSQGRKTVFDAGSFAYDMIVKRPEGAKTWDQVLETVGKALGEESTHYMKVRHAANHSVKDKIAAFKDSMQRYSKAYLEKIEDPKNKEAAEAKLDFQRDLIVSHLNALKPMETVVLETGDGLQYGAILSLEPKGRTRNPAAKGDWSLRIALAGSPDVLEVPLSQVDMLGKGRAKVNITRVSMATIEDNEGLPKLLKVRDYFDFAAKEAVERRVIVTGNLFKAAAKLPRAKMVSFTDTEGQVRMGLMLPRGTSLESIVENAPVQLGQVGKQIDFVSKGGVLQSIDGTMKLSVDLDTRLYRVVLPASKAVGGRYYLDAEFEKALGAEFAQNGSRMVVADIPEAQFKKALRYLNETKQVPLLSASMHEQARAIAGEAGISTATTIVGDIISANPAEKLDNDSQQVPVTGVRSEDVKEYLGRSSIRVRGATDGRVPPAVNRKVGPRPDMDFTLGTPAVHFKTLEEDQHQTPENFTRAAQELREQYAVILSEEMQALSEDEGLSSEERLQLEARAHQLAQGRYRDERVPDLQDILKPAFGEDRSREMAEGLAVSEAAALRDGNLTAKIVAFSTSPTVGVAVPGHYLHDAREKATAMLDVMDRVPFAFAFGGYGQLEAATNIYGLLEKIAKNEISEPGRIKRAIEREYDRFIELTNGFFSGPGDVERGLAQVLTMVPEDQARGLHMPFKALGSVTGGLNDMIKAMGRISDEPEKGAVYAAEAVNLVGSAEMTSGERLQLRLDQARRQMFKELASHLEIDGDARAPQLSTMTIAGDPQNLPPHRAYDYFMEIAQGLEAQMAAEGWKLQPIALQMADQAWAFPGFTSETVPGYTIIPTPGFGALPHMPDRNVTRFMVGLTRSGQPLLPDTRFFTPQGAARLAASVHELAGHGDDLDAATWNTEQKLQLLPLVEAATQSDWDGWHKDLVGTFSREKLAEDGFNVKNHYWVPVANPERPEIGRRAIATRLFNSRDFASEMSPDGYGVFPVFLREENIVDFTKRLPAEAQARLRWWFDTNLERVRYGIAEDALNHWSSKAFELGLTEEQVDEKVKESVEEYDFNSFVAGIKRGDLRAAGDFAGDLKNNLTELLFQDFEDEAGEVHPGYAGFIMNAGLFEDEDDKEITIRSVADVQFDWPQVEAVIENARRERAEAEERIKAWESKRSEAEQKAAFKERDEKVARFDLGDLKSKGFNVNEFWYVSSERSGMDDFSTGDGSLTLFERKADVKDFGDKGDHNPVYARRGRRADLAKPDDRVSSLLGSIFQDRIPQAAGFTSEEDFIAGVKDGVWSRQRGKDGAEIRAAVFETLARSGYDNVLYMQDATRRLHLFEASDATMAWDTYFRGDRLRTMESLNFGPALEEAKKAARLAAPVLMLGYDGEAETQSHAMPGAILDRASDVRAIVGTGPILMLQDMDGTARIFDADARAAADIDDSLQLVISSSGNASVLLEEADVEVVAQKLKDSHPHGVVVARLNPATGELEIDRYQGEEIERSSLDNEAVHAASQIDHAQLREEKWQERDLAGRYQQAELAARRSEILAIKDGNRFVILGERAVRAAEKVPMLAERLSGEGIDAQTWIETEEELLDVAGRLSQQGMKLVTAEKLDRATWANWTQQATGASYSEQTDVVDAVLDREASLAGAKDILGIGAGGEIVFARFEGTDTFRVYGEDIDVVRNADTAGRLVDIEAETWAGEEFKAARLNAADLDSISSRLLANGAKPVFVTLSPDGKAEVKYYSAESKVEKQQLAEAPAVEDPVLADEVEQLARKLEESREEETLLKAERLWQKAKVQNPGGLLVVVSDNNYFAFANDANEIAEFAGVPASRVTLDGRNMAMMKMSADEHQSMREKASSKSITLRVVSQEDLTANAEKASSQSQTSSISGTSSGDTNVRSINVGSPAAPVRVEQMQTYEMRARAGLKGLDRSVGKFPLRQRMDEAISSLARLGGDVRPETVVRHLDERGLLNRSLHKEVAKKSSGIYPTNDGYIVYQDVSGTGWAYMPMEAFAEAISPDGDMHGAFPIGAADLINRYTGATLRSLDASFANDMAAIRTFVRNEASRINPNVAVTFADRVFGQGSMLMAGGGMSSDRQPVLGLYFRGVGHLTASTDLSIGDPQKSAYHELFHSVSPLMNDTERKLINSTFPPRGGLSSEELAAEAFAEYAMEKLADNAVNETIDARPVQARPARGMLDGRPTREYFDTKLHEVASLTSRGARRAAQAAVSLPKSVLQKLGGGSKKAVGPIGQLFEGVADFGERVGNFARFRGFQTPEDIFKRIGRGHVGARARVYDAAMNLSVTEAVRLAEVAGFSHLAETISDLGARIGSNRMLTGERFYNLLRRQMTDHEIVEMLLDEKRGGYHGLRDENFSTRMMQARSAIIEGEYHDHTATTPEDIGASRAVTGSDRGQPARQASSSPLSRGTRYSVGAQLKADAQPDNRSTGRVMLMFPDGKKREITQDNFARHMMEADSRARELEGRVKRTRSKTNRARMRADIRDQAAFKNELERAGMTLAASLETSASPIELASLENPGQNRNSGKTDVKNKEITTNTQKSDIEDKEKVRIVPREGQAMTNMPNERTGASSIMTGSLEGTTTLYVPRNVYSKLVNTGGWPEGLGYNGQTGTWHVPKDHANHSDLVAQFGTDSAKATWARDNLRLASVSAERADIPTEFRKIIYPALEDLYEIRRNGSVMFDDKHVVKGAARKGAWFADVRDPQAAALIEKFGTDKARLDFIKGTELLEDRRSKLFDHAKNVTLTAASVGLAAAATDNAIDVATDYKQSGFSLIDANQEAIHQAAHATGLAPDNVAHNIEDFTREVGQMSIDMLVELGAFKQRMILEGREFTDTLSQEYDRIVSSLSDVREQTLFVGDKSYSQFSPGLQYEGYNGDNLTPEKVDTLMAEIASSPLVQAIAEKSQTVSTWLGRNWELAYDSAAELVAASPDLEDSTKFIDDTLAAAGVQLKAAGTETQAVVDAWKADHPGIWESFRDNLDEGIVAAVAATGAAAVFHAGNRSGRRAEWLETAKEAPWLLTPQQFGQVGSSLLKVERSGPDEKGQHRATLVERPRVEGEPSKTVYSVTSEDRISARDLLVGYHGKLVHEAQKAGLKIEANVVNGIAKEELRKRADDHKAFGRNTEKLSRALLVVGASGAIAAMSGGLPAALVAAGSSAAFQAAINNSGLKKVSERLVEGLQSVADKAREWKARKVPVAKIGNSPAEKTVAQSAYQKLSPTRAMAVAMKTEESEQASETLSEKEKLESGRKLMQQVISAKLKSQAREAEQMRAHTSSKARRGQER